MTDNEIIKALECCQQYGFGNCPECPVYEDGGCVRELMKRALDLIKRQQEEIEKLKNEKVKHHLIATAVIDEDVLKKFVDEGLKKVECDIIKVRNETIKEFAERLKQVCGKIKTEGQSMLVCRESSFDNLEKEMTEGKDAGKDI